jgi:hypothetical protein
LSFSPINRTSLPTGVPRRLAAMALSLAVAGVLAMMPSAATALPTSVTPASVNVTSGELGTIKVNALGLTSGQLASVLVNIPALSAVPTSTLTPIIAGLPTSSLQTLLNAIKTATGINVSVGETTQVLLGDAVANPAVLANVLADVTSLLNGGPQAGALQEVLENLIDGLTPAQLQQLETALGIAGDPAELASSLLTKLAAHEVPSIEGLSTLLGELGTTAATTGAQLAGAAGTSPGALSGLLGIPESILATASGTSTPIGPLSGLLTVLGTPGAGGGEGGLSVGTVPTSTTSNTGSSTTNSTTTGSSTTIAPAALPVNPPPASKSTVTKVKIISHKVKGHVLTLVVKAPASGKLTVSAAHVTSQSKKTTKAQTVTFRLALTKAGIASVKRHRKINAKVKVAFKPTSGTASSATTTAHFH